MIVQCRVCKRIRDNGRYRPALSEEIDPNESIADTYCPPCAQATLQRIQNGEIVCIFESQNTRKAVGM